MGKKLAFIFKLRREFAFSYGQGHIFPLVDIIHPTTDPEYITIIQFNLTMLLNMNEYVC